MLRADEVPIYCGLLSVAGLMIVDTRSVKLHVGWLLSAALLLLIAIPLPGVLSRLDFRYYNLKDLLRHDNSLTNLRLMLLCLWGPLTVSWATDLWKKRLWKQAIAWAPASCLVAWGILRRSVTVESIHDVLGSPVWRLPMDLEYIARFASLYLLFVWLPLFFVILALSSRRRFIVCIVFSVVFILAAPIVLHNFSPSDNISELFRTHGPRWFAGLCLFTIWVAVLCSKTGRIGWLASLGLAVLAVWPAWALLVRSIQVDSVHGLCLGLPLFAGVFLLTILCLIPAMSCGSTDLQPARMR